MPNKFWEETWGGGLKFYNESSKFNYVVDFVPGRVIFFDSKIDHEVLPLTINAKRSRYSLAMKCAGVSAVEYLKNSFGDGVVEIKHV
jgi:Rps23 Pro-64 3,4-dihydroxylase Tpa1-like proline 4-hydroxylase